DQALNTLVNLYDSNMLNLLKRMSHIQEAGISKMSNFKTAHIKVDLLTGFKSRKTIQAIVPDDGLLKTPQQFFSHIDHGITKACCHPLISTGYHNIHLHGLYIYRNSA